jgi:hypothetical protein
LVKRGFEEEALEFAEEEDVVARDEVLEVEVSLAEGDEDFRREVGGDFEENVVVEEVQDTGGGRTVESTKLDIHSTLRRVICA